MLHIARHEEVQSLVKYTPLRHTSHRMNPRKLNTFLPIVLRLTDSQNARIAEANLLAAVLHGLTPVILAEHLGFFASRRTTPLV